MSVYRWQEMAEEGPDGLAAKPHLGRPRLMTPAQDKRLVKLLLKGPVAHGWSNELWTAKRAAVLIRREFRIQYHPEHVRHILKDRLGWSSQKPEKRARERNEPEIERWKRDEFPRIKKTTKRGAAPLFSKTNRDSC